MQPCSREMQVLNSLLNSSQISLQDLHNNHQIQNQNPQMINNNQNQNQLNPHFDHTSNDDFLEQMLSNLPSCTWPDLNPNNTTTTNNNNSNKHLLWDPHSSSSLHNTNNNTDDTTPSNETAPSNVVASFPYDEHVSLASKFRNHQISAASPTSKSATAAAALMLQQQLLMSRGVAGAADSGLLQMPLSLGGNDVVDGSSFKSPNPSAEASVQALYSGFAGSLHGTGQTSNQTQHFQPPQGSSNPNYGGSGGSTAPNNNQGAASGGPGGTPGQPRQRVRARRGQATDPHSIAERLRRERIAERMKALQELVPNANKTDKASMLDEIIDYVKFLQLQVKVLSMSRLGGAAAVAPLVADIASEGGGDCIQANGSGALTRNTSNGNQTAPSTSNDTLAMTEHQVAKLMEEDMGSAMQYLQGKGLCLMPISLATAISTATCHTRNPLTTTTNNNGGNGTNLNPAVTSNGEGPSSPSMSVLTVQSANAGNDSAVKDAASVSKP